jgi:hypothetical protein
MNIQRAMMPITQLGRCDIGIHSFVTVHVFPAANPIGAERRPVPAEGGKPLNGVAVVA